MKIPETWKVIDEHDAADHRRNVNHGNSCEFELLIGKGCIHGREVGSSVEKLFNSRATADGLIVERLLIFTTRNESESTGEADCRGLRIVVPPQCNQTDS